MIRPIAYKPPPPPPPKVDPKANAEQASRLQAEATKLRNEIRLANKMGESDWAASARQRLMQVNTELNTAQTASPAAQPTPVQPVGGAAAPQGNGTTAAPALFTTQNFSGAPNLLLTNSPSDGGAASPEAATARDIVADIEGGKSIDNIADERDMSPEDVVAALNAGGMTATATEYANGDTRQVVITVGNRTITENQDYHHGGYYTEVTAPDGQTTSSPIRDDLGRTETTSVDPETGAITTKHVADLGDGAVTERTSNPQTGITTTTHTAADGAVTVTKNLPNGSTVKTVAPNNSVALPVTTVTGPDGKEVILAQTQTSDGSGAQSIQEQLAEGKSIDEIAKERGLKPEQVIAELNAAGLEVTQGGDPGETLQTVVTDPHTGKTVTYNNDYHHGSRSVTVTEGNTETTDTVDGNGRTSHTVRNTETGEQTTTIVDPKNHTKTTIVLDKDGRRTETIVEELNDGKPIDYEVKPGDNLSDIAEAHGVTLQDLAKSNPELFTSPRDPDLIHPGETVVIEGGTKTTVKVTFNGYTLTTHPDGNMTLLNHAEGTELKFEAGSALDGLSQLLMDVNPSSSDPEKAKEGQTIKTAVEMVLYGENLPDLGETAKQKEKETLAAVEQYGIGNPGEKKPGVAGARPQGKAPSGGDWVQARGLWVDPHIARAMAAEDVAKSALVEIPAKINQLSAQLDVYAHDPAYNGALKAADAQLDKILAPYGLEWNPPETKGTLADANTRLTEANTRLKEASDASAAYQEAVTLLDRAIRQQEYAAQFPDGTHPVAVAAGSDYNYQEEVRKGDLARADANTLFAEASAQTSKGDKLLADHQVGNLTTALNEAIDKHGGAVLEVPEGTLKPGEQPVEIEIAGTKLRVAPEVAEAYKNGDQGAIAASGKAVAIQIDGEWKWVHPEVAAATIELDAAKKQQSHAEKNLGVAQAYANVAVTGQEVAEFDDLKARLIEQYRLENPDHFIPDKEYSSVGGDYYGKIISREVIEKDGDLYLVLKFEHDDYVQEKQLTSISGSEDDPESARNNPLNEEWRKLWYGSNAAACGTDGLAANGGLEGLKKAQIEAGEQAKNAEIARFDLGIEDINTEITNLTEARDAAVTEHGAGTVEAPEGTLPPGVAPVKITVDGRDLWVAPEVAEAHNQGKPGAFDGVKAVQIQIDGQWKWVHPEVAAAEMELDAAEQEKKNLEENRQIAVVARDGYSFALKQPVKIFADEESAAKEEARLQYTYLEEDRDNALANYQLQFKSLYEQGYTEDFRQVEDLNSEVTKIFDLDTTTEEGRESLEKITEEVSDIAGEDARIRAVPMFFIDETTTPQKVVLLAVQDGDGVRYVDVKGGAYGNVGEFQDNNDIFDENGKLILPKDFNMKPGADGKIALDVIQPREFSTWETIVDPIVGIGTGLATIASFTPLAPVAAPLAYAGGAYLATRAVFKQVDHLKYGGEWGETESLMNVATVATTALPMGSSLVRTAGLARTGMSGGKAFAGSLGISRSADDGFLSFGRYGQSLPSSQQLSTAVQTMRTSPGSLKWVAWTMDAGAVTLGAPLLYVSAEDLVLHGSEMSGLELANAITGLGTGVFGTGMGLRGLRTMFPGKSGQPGGVAPNSPVPVAPGGQDSGPQPRVVYAEGPDGVHGSTGRYVMPDPNEVVIDGEVVGETPGQQRALPAGSPEGVGEQPPGGKGDPSGGGQPSRPTVTQPADAGGVNLPIQNIPHPPRPAIEGTADVHDAGAPAPGERGDPENASDRSAQETRDQNARQPADGDPIVVPPVRDGGTMHPAESGFRLVWDPVTKTFTGMPKPDAGEYIYTSGKDPQQTSYVEGARPSDPAILVTPDELLLQSETETRDGSSRETTERQGPSGAKQPEGRTEGTRPLMRYTLGNRHTGEMLVNFNLPEGQRVVAVPEPKAIAAAPEPVKAPVELDPSLPVLYLGADGRWSTDPNVRTEPAMTDTGHPSPVRSDGTPIINNFSSNPYSFGQTFNAVKAGLRRIGTRYLNTEPRYDYPKLGELVDSIYHRPVPHDGVTAGQDIYVEAGGEYLQAKVVMAGPQADMTRDIVLPGEHASEAGYLGSGSTVERAKRGSITTPNGQLRVNTPAREVHTFDPADNPEVSHRSALGETLAATLPALPDDAAPPAPRWTPEQVGLVGDYLHSLERSSDPVVRDQVTMTRVQLGGRGLPQSGTEMTPAQHHALVEMLNADRNSPFTGSKPVGQLSMNGLTTLQVFSAQGKLPHRSPAEVIDQLGLSSDGRLAGGEQFFTAGALPGEAGWTDAGRGIVGDYLKAASISTDPNLAAAANAASPFFKGRATKPGKAVTAAQQDALMQVLQADSGSTWVYGPKLQPESSFKPAGKLSPEGRYNEKVLSGHETWTPYLWREMRGYAVNQQKSADPAVQSLASALENALPGSKPKTGTEINSEVPVLLERLLAADKASSWRAPTFFTDAQGVWRSDRATVSWFLQEHEANVLGGPVLNNVATNAVGLGNSIFGIKVPLPSRQVYGELSLKNNGPDGTGFLLPVHPNDAKGQKLFANGYRPNFVYDETAAPSARWVASAPMLSKNTFQSENAVGASISIAGFSIGGAYVKRTLLYLGGEGGRPGYTHREPGPLSQRAASFWEEAARGGASHYSAEGKVPGFEDRLLFRNYNVIPPFGGGKEPWRGSPAFEGVPRETGAGPLNRLDRTDHGAGFAVNLGQWPVTTVELGSVRKDVVPHTRPARAHLASSEGAQKVFSALEASDGRLTPDVMNHLDAYLAEVAVSPHGDLRFAGQRVSDVFPELGVTPYPDQLATASGRPDGMSRPAWKTLRQQLDQQARGELTPTQAHYLNRLLEQDVLHNTPPSNALPPAGDGPVGPRSPAPRPTSEGQGSGSPEKSLQVRDENGQLITATYLGTPPKSAENVYVPPADGPQLRGDDPAVADKSHILVRDPETGQPVVLPWIRGASQDHVPGGSKRPDDPTSSYEAAMEALGAGPQRKELEAAPPTTYTLEQVRRMRQPDKWKAGELYTRELNGSPGEEHFRVPADPTGPYPVVGDGGRFVDAPVHNARGDIEAIEVKTYHRWRTVKGIAEMREVPLSQHLRQQINKDVALMGSTPGYEPRWVFLDAPPSPELQKALDDAGIVGNIMGHNKSNKTRTSAASSEGTSGAPKLTDAEQVANREEALQLFDGMIAQDLRLPEATIVDIADQFSRSPKLMNMLRAAHDGNVRIVNPARPELHIQTTDGRDVTARGAFYNHQTRVVSLDGEVSGSTMSPEEVAAEYVRFLSHELSHFADPAFPKPAHFGSEGAFTRAYVDARLLNEGRARLGEFVGSDELSANGGQPLHGLDDASGAEKAVFEDFKAGKIGEEAAARQLGDLLRNEQRSDAAGSYGDVYTQAARAIWERPAVEGSGVDAFGRPAGLDGASAAPAANSGKLTRDGVRAVPLDQVQNLDMAAFQPDQVAWLTREQVANLTEQQFRHMDQLGLLPHLTKSQLRGIPKAKIGDLNVAGLDARQIPWLTNGQVGKLSETQFADLGRADLLRHLTKPQLQGIPGDKIGFLDVSKLDASQVPWLTRKQVANLTEQQFKDLGEAGLLRSFTEGQVQAIPADKIDVAKLDPTQVPWLTDAQIAALTRDQWGAFTVNHIEALTRPQIEAMKPEQFEEMSPGQFRKFTLEQVEWMSTDQANALSVLQLTTFRATHKKAMTQDQRTLVEGALVYSRIKEYQAALDTFGTMAGSSYMMWSALPPNWTATAGAVAFGVRGVVFSAQALFPNATANHKPFGRFLNALGGATFIAAAPGAATGMIQGKDLVVNSTFTLGNIVYGTKSMLQSFTGRPVIRNLAEYLAGPGYVLGCAVYTVSSWPSPIATTAGTLFTFGCAEFWASAIRTDRVNRRPVPKTEADIAAAEKSDKFWAGLDRWTLGITFGVGMLLFSLDALLAEPWEGAKTTPPPDPKKPDGDASSQQPDDPSETPDEPEVPAEQFPQLVVVAGDGLNLRSQPNIDSARIIVLEPGTFVDQTGKPASGPSDQAWIPVEGYGADGESYAGWVSGEYVAPHPDGARNSEGRINPALEQRGYRWVEARDGDRIRAIANANSADVAETVVLNMDHILSPDMIFAGDRIYLPK